VITVSKSDGFDNAILEICEPFFKRFKINKILRRFYAVKQKGVSVYAAFLFLIGLVFSGKNLYGVIKTEPERIDFEKDVVYRLLGDSRIYWEQILAHTAYAVIAELKQAARVGITKEAAQTRYLEANVVDDTPIYRNRSKKVELLSRFFDHSTNRYYKGFDLLGLGWTDGQTYIPVMAQMVASGNNDNLLEGSHIKEDRRTLATRRRVNARKDKNTLTLQMLQAINGTPAQSQYVLFDSWFESPLSLTSIKNIGYDVVARAKNNENYRYLYKGEMRSISRIYQMNKKRRGKSRYLLSVDIHVRHEDFDGEVDAKLVFVRDRANRKKWICFVSTDVSLTETEILDLYELRWKIEGFFKVIKTFLHIETEFQTRSFDAITAHASIVMIRYIILALKNREAGDGSTVHGVFFALCHVLDSITFKNLFSEISGTIIAGLIEIFHAVPDKVTSFFEFFMANLPDNIKGRLVLSI